MRIPFAVQSYQHESLPLSAQRVVNCFPEHQPQEAKSPVALLFRPGLKLFSTVGTGPIRGVVEMNGVLYVVSANRLFKVDSGGVATSLGTVGTTTTGLVSMDENGTQLVILNDNDGYVYDRILNTLVKITDPDFGKAVAVKVLDSYHIFVRPNSGQFFISALNDPTSYAALDFATAEGDSDILVNIAVDHKQLLLFGTDTIEPWYNSGDVFPFDRVSGAFIQSGLGAKFSIANLDNSVYWLAKEGVVFRLDGFTPRRVSTHAIEQAISKFPNFGDARAMAIRWKGHAFYVLTFPQEATFVYDAATELWHEWESFGQKGFIGSSHVEVYGRHVIGDEAAANIYILDDDARTDNVDPIQRLATGAPLYATGTIAFMPMFEAVFETGVGATVGQGSDPQAMMQYSNDGGRTWSSEIWRSMGKIGEYEKRVVWRRLGKFRERTIRWTVSDPVVVRFLGANADLVGEG